MQQPIKVLIVEDNPTDAELLLHELRRAGFDPDWSRVDTEGEYLNRLDVSIDVILSDYDMPQFSGTRALALLNQRGLKIPFIIVSGKIGEETAVAAMKDGASDYLLKDRIGRLGSAITRALRETEERNERKKLQGQLIEAQKMEVLGRLAGGIAHDFNNLLAVIMGYSGLLIERLGRESPMIHQVEEIESAAVRAKGLTEQLLIFSRKQTVELEVLDLNEVTQGMDKMLRRLINENIELTLVLGDQLGHVKGDSGQIGQVLMNLVVNARDAMPHAGKLTIQTGNVTLDEGYARTHPGVACGDYVMLAVSDTGIGMTEEVKKRLFEAFFTTKPEGKGTGLGLATCQAIVKQCDGHIEIVSEVGRGTAFKIYFPRVDQPLTESALASPGPADALPGGTETLLLVEDEPSVRHLTCGVLEARGYKVLRASNGQEGLRVAREFAGSPIRLVVTDVIMPQMGGRVMADWLKTIYPDLKVLFTSGYTADAIEPHGVFEPGVAFLPKPYTIATLTRKVRDLLDGRITEDTRHR